MDAQDFWGTAEAEAATRYAPLATPSDAHTEWHLNTGVPMGTPGCPQDACHPAEDHTVEETQTGPRCGNQTMHGQNPVHHRDADAIRFCFAITEPIGS